MTRHPSARSSLAHLRTALSIGALIALPASAGPLAPDGCPIFHCTPEATGVMSQPIINAPASVLVNGSLGTLQNQGCSGDGTRVACLFTTDAVAGGIAKGTLKMLDATTLQPVWGTAGVAGSYDIDPTGFSTGQVPVFFADGTIAAGDSNHYVRYSPTGQALQQLDLNGRGKNMGLTPISDRYGVITQANGTFTLVDLASWTKVSDVLVKADGANAQIMSPSSAGDGVLYAVGLNNLSQRGYLFVLAVTTDRRGRDTLGVRATFTFYGSSGSSAVVLKPQATGLAGNLVLLHVSGLPEDGATPRNRLMGLLDTGGSTLPTAWPPILLDDALNVSPAIDTASRSLFLRYPQTAFVHRYDYMSGTFAERYDIRAIGGYPASFKLNGHLPSSQSSGLFTLLLSGAYRESRTNQGQLAIAFRPLVTPNALLWSRQILNDKDAVTSAWTVGPAHTPGQYCPIVVGSTTGLSLVCD